MKSLVYLCLMASLATVVWTNTITWGIYRTRDYLLHREDIVHEAQEEKILNEYFAYPSDGQPRIKNISLIYITDHLKNNDGAEPQLWDGGPGYNFVQLYLGGHLNKAINSTIEIYGS